MCYNYLGKNLQVTMDTYIKTLSNDLVDKVPLKAPENMSWSYKNLSDAVAYNLTTGEILGTYLNKKITLLLNASIPNSNISYTKEVTFNASVISSNYVGLFHRNDASCMTPVDSGEYSPDSSKYIGWSNYILYVGNYALPVATGNFFEVTSSSNVTKVNWTSCGGLYINKTGSAWTFTPNDLFHSESPAYGYIVIGTNGKLRVVSDTTDYTAQITLQANEAIFVTRYLERTIDGTPYTSITTNFNTSTDAQIVKVETKEFNNVVQTLIDIINGLPTEITLSDEKTVKDAEQIYSSLSDEEKALVTNYSKLEAAIAKIEELNGEAYQFMLKQEEAKQEVLNYVSLNDYSKENQSAIKRYQLVANQGIEGAKTEEQLNAIREKVDALSAELKAAGIRVKFDDDDTKKPGWKFAEYELKGVPVRLAMGARDLENNTVEVARRDTLTKETVSFDGLVGYIQSLLDKVQNNIFQKAVDYRASVTREVNSYEEFKVEIEKGGFLLCHWDGTPETEELIKQETKATIRCIPLEGDTTPGVCMVTGKPSKQRVIFARAY